MKKMIRSSKKGFTLAEIILVVAIVVILSAVAFVGVGSVINNAKNTSKKLEENNGDNFEAEAWGEVKSITRGAADFFDIPYYTPEGGDSDDEDGEGEPDSTEPGGGWEGGSGGGGGGGYTPPETRAPTSTPVPTATPTPKPAGGGIVPASGATNDGLFKLTSNGGNSVHMVGMNNSGDTVDFSVTKNSDGSYNFSVTGGNKWLIANNYKQFENSGIAFWQYGETFSVKLDSSFKGLIEGTWGLNL